MTHQTQNFLEEYEQELVDEETLRRIDWKIRCDHDLDVDANFVEKNELQEHLVPETRELYTEFLEDEALILFNMYQRYWSRPGLFPIRE